MKQRNVVRDSVLPAGLLKKTSFGPCRSRLTAISLTVVLSSACSAKPGQVPMQVDGEDAVPSRLPISEEMLEVTAPGYKQPAGDKSECLGRLVFEVGREVQWPVFFNKDNANGPFNRPFSRKIASPGDNMRFGSTRIAVIGSVEGVKKEKLLEVTPRALEAHLQKRIGETLEYIEEQKKLTKNVEVAKKEIEEAESWIRMWEKTIQEHREEFETFDPGVPVSQGYWTSTIEGNDDTNRYSVLRAYLTRGEYIYVFESTVKMNTPADKDAHKRDFSAMLKKFRTRAANEIPSEPGVCFPYGFIPDDGRTVVEFKQSLRYPDAPGVLYTIETGTVHPRRMKATPLLAAAHASINPPPATEDDQVRRVVTQRIGPHAVRMGGLSALQGGVVLQADTGNEKYDIYNVFSGYSGWLGTAVLPYILVEMHTVNRDRVPELKKPPPYAQSKERLDVLLKSMRWRPTNPPMSEFQRK